MTEPDSLTVTEHIGIDGAKIRGEALEAGATVCGVDELGYTGIEVGEPVQAASSYSGEERQQKVILPQALHLQSAVHGKLFFRQEQLLAVGHSDDIST